jgi:hypothetical protein
MLNRSMEENENINIFNPVALRLPVSQAVRQNLPPMTELVLCKQIYRDFRSTMS